MKYKGVIFDLDGTLVNSIEDLAESMNVVLRKHGFPTHKINDYEEFIGNGILNLVKKALPEFYRDDEKCMIYYYMMFDVYSENCTNKTRPYVGITQLLDELVSSNIKLSVLSNKADNLTKKAVTTLLPNVEFESVNGLTDEETKKPNPTKAIQICSSMGFDPHEMIFVGDSGVDMQTAKNAGMNSVGVLWGFRSEEELLKDGAKHLIAHPIDLLGIIKYD